MRTKLWSIIFPQMHFSGEKLNQSVHLANEMQQGMECSSGQEHRQSLLCPGHCTNISACHQLRSPLTATLSSSRALWEPPQGTEPTLTAARPSAEEGKGQVDPQDEKTELSPPQRWGVSLCLSAPFSNSGPTPDTTREVFWDLLRV